MKKIYVTKTFLPSQEEYSNILKQAWEKGWIANRGELVLELEKKLKNFLKVRNLLITNNGTISLQIALKLLSNKTEVITTPFSYVATVSSIIWEDCSPVFVDIHPEYLTIDETKIEAAITDKTTTIMATHVYGNPCNVEVIDTIAKKNDLKVIYDAAHCFGVTFNGRSIFDYGDVSTCSFHATKLFHTGEGGAIFCRDDELFEACYYSHNFGHDGPLNYHGLGINGKISELQAALGLAVLPYMSHIIEERKKVVEYYNNNLVFSKLKCLKIRSNTEWNYSYYPIIFENEDQLLITQSKLNESNIFTRRYFYPSLNTISFIKGRSMPISEDISVKVLCLPLYVGLNKTELDLIVDIINKSIC